MRALTAIAGLCALLAVVASCKHDLDKLRGDGPSNLRSGSGGSAGRSLGAGRGSDAGRGGSGGSDGGSGGAAPSPSACEPCPPLASGASALGLRSCCRGAANNECGLTFAQGSLCLPRMVPAQPDPACEAVSSDSMSFEGCCRPDGRCGAVASQLGLGCVARDEIPPAVGGTDEPIPCQYECDADSDCGGLAGGFVCTETRTHTERFCANDCRRDEDCTGSAVCALSVDIELDRVVAICQQPLGDVLPGGFCSAPNDCVHGACVTVAGGQPYCSELCRNPTDCPTAYPDCYPEQIPSPTGDREDEFTICGNVD